MAVLHHDHENHAFIHIKGAPEAVLSLCTNQRVADGGTAPLDRDHWEDVLDSLASEGQRVIAVAARPVAPETHGTQHLRSRYADDADWLDRLDRPAPPRSN